MTPTESKFQTELEIFDGEIRSAIQFFYFHISIHQNAGRDRTILDAVNRDLLFWNTALGATQTALFITLGRMFDQDSNSHGVKRLVGMAKNNIDMFSLSALSERKRMSSPNADEWLPDYLRSAYVPSMRDFARMERYLSKYEKVYERSYSRLRKKFFAHKDRIDLDEVENLFSKTKVLELRRMLGFLHRLHDALWQLFCNGRKPLLWDYSSENVELQSRMSAQIERILNSLARSSRS